MHTHPIQCTSLVETVPEPQWYHKAHEEVGAAQYEVEGIEVSPQPLLLLHWVSEGWNGLMQDEGIGEHWYR